jgi:hypothetical protein
LWLADGWSQILATATATLEPMHMGTTTTTTIASNHHNDSKIFRCLGTYAINNDDRTARWEASKFFFVQGKIINLFYLSKP